MYREPTYVDEVFGGVLVSTISCAECRNVRGTHVLYLNASIIMYVYLVQRVTLVHYAIQRDTLIH